MASTYTARPGPPCWYELGTDDLEAASEFYAAVLGWQTANEGGSDYVVGLDADGNGVAGMMRLADQEGEPPPNWVFYLEVADADASARAVAEAGGAVLMEPRDIPDTGRFAVVADPQGAVFSIMAPRPPEEPPNSRAFEPERIGHGSWHELTTTDPEAAMAFYASVFGWNTGEKLEMGESGGYQIVEIDGQAAGGIMQLGGREGPAWLSYFTVPSVDDALGRARSAGGRIVTGPNEAPGGILTAVITDPQGAGFGISGGR